MKNYKPIKIILISLFPTTIFASQCEIGISGGIKVLKIIAQWVHDGMNFIKIGQLLIDEDLSRWYILMGVVVIWGFLNIFFKSEEE